MNLYPSILTESIVEAQAQLEQVKLFPKIRTVQIDVIDGFFADNLTISPADLPTLQFGELSCDLHFMTVEPLDFVYEAVEHKKHIPVRAVIGQVEHMSSQVAFLEEVKKNAWQAGLSIDIFTPLEEIDDEAWRLLDSIQLMSIEAGFQGQEFKMQAIDKISELQKLLKQSDRNVEIIIDGGVTPDIADTLNNLGVSSIIVGSGLWQADDIAVAVNQYLDVD